MADISSIFKEIYFSDYTPIENPTEVEKCFLYLAKNGKYYESKVSSPDVNYLGELVWKGNPLSASIEKYEKNNYEIPIITGK